MQIENVITKGNLTAWWALVSEKKTVSELHFNVDDCMFMDPGWITPQEQVAIINEAVMKNDTFICPGDVGRPEYIKDIKARNTVTTIIV